MDVTFQHTLDVPVRFEGIGVHAGERACARLLPAPAGSGVRFRRLDVEGSEAWVEATGLAVSDTRLCTTISNAAGVSVSTVEHLLAAFAGLGIDNAVVEVEGPELPILDGSCRSLVALIDRAGRRPQGALRSYFEVLEPIVLEDGERGAGLYPAEALEFDVEICFPGVTIGRQRLELIVDESNFRSELADARTFGFFEEVEVLRATGLARGGSLDNAVVLQDDRVLNPEGLRRPNEFVRHKALDALGDLFLLGAPLLGRYEARRPGHALNNALVRKALETPNAWRLTYPQPSLAAAG